MSNISSSFRTLVNRTLVLRIISVSIGIIVGSLLAELGLRLFWSESENDRYYIWLPHTSATFTPAAGVMPGVGPVGRIQINSVGIRGPEWLTDGAKEYRILTAGGSTTECLYLDQDKTWTAILQRELSRTADGRSVWAGSVGKSGFNTRDHLALMRFVIDQYHINAIVLLIGGNDMVHRLLQGDSYEPHFVDDEVRYRKWLYDRFASVPTRLEWGRSLVKSTALGGLVQKLSLLYKNSRNIVQDRTGGWLIKYRRYRQEALVVDNVPSLDSGLNEYERNVEKIARMARKRGLRIVLMTQPTLWKENMSRAENESLWMGWRPDGKFSSAAALARAMASYNQRLLDTCERLKLECIDLATRIPRTLDIFYDDMHFTEEGSRLVAVELSTYFRSRDSIALGDSVTAFPGSS